MTNSNKLLFECSGVDNLILATHDFSAKLSKEESDKFLEIVRNYLVNYGTQGAFDRVIGRSFSEILIDYQPSNREIVTTGKVDEVRFSLFEAPLSDP